MYSYIYLPPFSFRSPRCTSARRPGDEAYIETCNVNVCTPGQSTPSVVNQTVFRKSRIYTRKDGLVHEITEHYDRVYDSCPECTTNTTELGPESDLRVLFLIDYNYTGIISYSS